MGKKLFNMSRRTPCLAFLLLATLLFAQCSGGSKANDNTVEGNDSAEQVYTKVEVMPQFPGGDTELTKFLGKSVKYPVIAQENGIQGKVVCSFIVSKDGSLSDYKVVRGTDPSLDGEAIRVLKMMPKWTPGTEKGKAVNVLYTVPVTFRLQ